MTTDTKRRVKWRRAWKAAQKKRRWVLSEHFQHWLSYWKCWAKGKIKLPQWICFIFKNAIICSANEFDGLWLCENRLLQFQMLFIHIILTNEKCSAPEHRNSLILFFISCQYCKIWINLPFLHRSLLSKKKEDNSQKQDKRYLLLRNETKFLIIFIYNVNG